MESKFYNYHYQIEPLLLANVWDVSGARVFEKIGFKAIGTSSAAIANTLGYEDGENIPFQEYLFMIERIQKSTQLPLTVDLEAGYGDSPEDILNNINQLIDLSVAGINLEDSVIINGERKLVDIETFTEKLRAIKYGIKHSDIFLNLRSDTFLLQIPYALEESKKRIDYYSEYIDGIFLPCITQASDIKAITDFTELPLNVMCMPNLPSFDELKSLEVKRISMGNFQHHFILNTLEKSAKEILEERTFHPIL